MGVKTYRYILAEDESLRVAYDFFDGRTNPMSNSFDNQLFGHEIYDVKDALYSGEDLPKESRERRNGQGLVTRTVFFRDKIN
jgi:hypothetical protein